jgi:hypothetical protein
MLSFKNRACSDRKTGVTFAEYARADKPRTLCLFFKFSEAGCRRAQQMSTGHNRGQGKAIMQKRVICLDRTGDDARLRPEQRLHRLDHAGGISRNRVAEISAQTTHRL